MNDTPRIQGLVSCGVDGYVRVCVGKGCILKMPIAHYEAAIHAGKAEVRALRQAQREQQGQAVQEAQTLAWIDEE